ncbi:MAG: hypothetical protein EBS94_17240 [Proteobacteria bacterium]|nr:hypothetical protein [Pseudomonadota bacterium]
MVPVPVPESATASRPAPVGNDHGAAHPDQAGSGPVIRLTIPSLPSFGDVLRQARVFPIPVHATMGPRRLAIAAFAAVVLAIGLSPVGGTIATFVASLINPESAFQSGTVRLASDGAGSSAFSLPALLPGESVERVITVSQSGSLDARLDLAILPDAGSSNSPLVTDPTTGIRPCPPRHRPGRALPAFLPPRVRYPVPNRSIGVPSFPGGSPGMAHPPRPRCQSRSPTGYDPAMRRHSASVRHFPNSLGWVIVLTTRPRHRVETGRSRSNGVPPA